MTSNVLTFPSGGTSGDNGHRCAKGSSPASDIMEVVRLNGAICKNENALHDVSTRNDRVLSALDPANVRLVSAELGRDPALRLSLSFSPFDQLHSRSPSYAGALTTQIYAVPTYLVNGHGDCAEAEYAPVAYVYQMHPGNRIRQVRKAAGLTQAELADRTGFAQDRISNYENGRRPLRLAELRVIARELHCAPADLLADDDNPERLSPRERALLEAFRSSSDDAQHFLLASAQAVSDQAEKQRNAA